MHTHNTQGVRERAHKHHTHTQLTHSLSPSNTHHVQNDVEEAIADEQIESCRKSEHLSLRDGFYKEMVLDFKEFERILTISGVMDAEDDKVDFHGQRDLLIQAFAHATVECEKRVAADFNNELIREELIREAMKAKATAYRKVAAILKKAGVSLDVHVDEEFREQNGDGEEKSFSSSTSFQNDASSPPQDEGHGRSGAEKLLVRACQKGNARLVAFLLDAGAKADSRAMNGMTCLMIACQKRDISLVDLLCDMLHRPDNDCPSNVDCLRHEARADLWARFRIACRSGCEDIASMLIPAISDYGDLDTKRSFDDEECYHEDDVSDCSEENCRKQEEPDTETRLMFRHVESIQPAELKVLSHSEGFMTSLMVASAHGLVSTIEYILKAGSQLDAVVVVNWKYLLFTE